MAYLVRRLLENTSNDSFLGDQQRGADIAEHLFLVPETVKSHIQNAMTKLDTHTRAHAVAVALVTEQIAWEG